MLALWVFGSLEEAPSPRSCTKLVTVSNHRKQPHELVSTSVPRLCCIQASSCVVRSKCFWFKSELAPKTKTILYLWKRPRGPIWDHLLMDKFSFKSPWLFESYTCGGSLMSHRSRWCHLDNFGTFLVSFKLGLWAGWLEVSCVFSSFQQSTLD